MDFRQLRTIVNVAELKSIRLAADRMNIAQSALSRQIRTLEEELQVRLFDRNGRGVEPTADGHALVARATVILREMEQARADIGRGGVLRGDVSFGMPPTVADVLAGPLIERFMQLHPQVKLRVVSGYSGYVLDWLQRGTIDLGVLYGARHPTTVRSRPLLVEELFLIRRAGGSGGGQISLAAIAAERLILPGRQHGLRLLLDELAAKEGMELDPVAEADSLPVQIDLVRRGLGATILPLLPVFRHVESGELTAHAFVSPGITRRLILARTVDRQISSAAQQFARLVRSEVASLVAKGRWAGTLAEPDVEGEMPEWHI